MLPVILIANFMSLFDFFVVNVAAPSLQSNLHASQSDLELVVGGYAFAYASCLVTGGRLGDQFSYRRMFLYGMGGFTVASALCGLAQSPGELVAARLAQGLTAAAMVPQVLALITAVFPPQERMRALAWFGVSIGLGSVAGQVGGGLLLDANIFGWGWRPIFLVNIPIGILTIAFGAKLVPALRSEKAPRLDPLGVIGLTGALGLILVPLTLGRVEGWPAWTWICMAVAVPIFVAVILWEHRLGRRGGQPLLDLSLFRNRAFCAGLGINMAAMAYFASFMFGLTLLLQAGYHLSPLRAGLTFALHGVVFAAVSVLARQVAGRIGPAATVTLGMSVVGVGLISMIAVVTASGTATGPAQLIGPIVVVGIGNGLAVPTFIGAVIAGVGPARAGAVAGILTTAQQFALAAGIAILGGVFFAVLGGNPARSQFNSAFRVIVALELALVVLSVALSFLLYKRKAGAPVPAAAPGAATAQSQPVR